MDSDELEQHYAEKLAAEKGETQQDRRAKTMEKIYGKDAPQPEPEADPWDTRSAAHQAVDSFLDEHPEFREEDAWTTLRVTALKSFHPDIYALRVQAEKTGTTSDIKKLFARAAEIGPGEKAAAERRAYVEFMAKQRHGDNGEAAARQLHKLMEKARSSR